MTGAGIATVPNVDLAATARSGTRLRDSVEQPSCRPVKVWTDIRIGVCPLALDKCVRPRHRRTEDEVVPSFAGNVVLKKNQIPFVNLKRISALTRDDRNRIEALRIRDGDPFRTATDVNGRVAEMLCGDIAHPAILNLGHVNEAPSVGFIRWVSGATHHGGDTHIVVRNAVDVLDADLPIALPVIAPDLPSTVIERPVDCCFKSLWQRCVHRDPSAFDACDDSVEIEIHLTRDPWKLEAWRVRRPHADGRDPISRARTLHDHGVPDREPTCRINLERPRASRH